MVKAILLKIPPLASVFLSIFKPMGDGGMPVPVKDSETIVRAIKKNFHLKKSGKLDKKAFLPNNGDCSFSAIRQIWGDNNCIQKAREISGADEYAGVAVILAQNIRRTESEVTDSRESNYYGHVDVDLKLGRYPDKPEPGEVMDPAVRKMFNDKCQKLAEYADLITDPNPQSVEWTGRTLAIG